MQILKHQQKSKEWLEARKGKITGSTLKDVLTKRGNGRKLGFYQLIADRLAIEPGDENPMERGERLEQEAADAFAKQANVKLHQDGMWISDDNPNMAVSPDRVLLSEDESMTRYAAVEIKCPSSARHIQTVIENDVPNEYVDQVVQYFVVNDDLESLYFVSYDPRVPSHPLHVVTVERETVAGMVDDYKKMEAELIAEVEAAVERLAF